MGKPKKPKRDSDEIVEIVPLSTIYVSGKTTAERLEALGKEIVSIAEELKKNNK